MTEIKTAQAWGEMSDQTISPCPKCGAVPRTNINGMPVCCDDGLYLYDDVMATAWQKHCERALGRACRELGIETVEQLRELVGIACDACDERTVRATNRAENLVPLLRRRAGERWW